MYPLSSAVQGTGFAPIAASREIGQFRSGAGPSVSVSDPWLLESSIGSGPVDWHLALLLTLSAIGAVIVFCLAAAAFHRRKSLPYLLITAALGALVLRPIVGAGTVLGYVSMNAHHTIEHLLDVIIAGFLIAAVVAVGSLESRSTEPSAEEDTE